MNKSLPLLATCGVVAIVTFIRSNGAIANIPQFVPPPPSVHVRVGAGKWANAMVEQRKNALASEARYIAIGSSLEPETAGIHVARPLSGITLAEYQAERRGIGRSGYEYWRLPLGALPAGVPTLIPIQETDLAERSDSYVVSLDRISSNAQFSASVVASPSGTGFTVSLQFTPRGIAGLADRVGPVVMLDAGYDWAGQWLQAGDTVTNFHGILVSDNTPWCEFSVRDLLASGGDTVVLDALGEMSQSDAASLAAMLN